MYLLFDDLDNCADQLKVLPDNAVWGKNLKQWTFGWMSVIKHKTYFSSICFLISNNCLIYYMSPGVRKPTICIYENIDADQLRGSREADQRLCFPYLDSTIPLLPKCKILCLRPSSVAAQPGLCQTWSESKLLVFLRRGSYTIESVIEFNLSSLLYLSHDVRKPDFCICWTKTQISFAVTAKLLSVLVFATQIVQSLYFLNPKFQVPSHL